MYIIFQISNTCIVIITSNFIRIYVPGITFFILLNVHGLFAILVTILQCLVKVPVERVLGHEFTQTTSRGTCRKYDCCYDVPLLRYLQSLFKCDSIVEQVSQST